MVLGRLGPEGVLHRAGRVVRAEVERVEVEPLGLDERTLGDLPAHRHEDVGDALGEHRDRVPGALGPAVPGQGDVHRLLDEHPLLGLDLELGLALRQRLVHRAAGLADALAGVLAGLRWQRADLPVGQSERRAVTGVLGADVLEGLEVRRRRRSRPAPSSRIAVTCSSSSGVTWTGSYSELGPDITCLSLQCTNGARVSLGSALVRPANGFAR